MERLRLKAARVCSRKSFMRFYRQITPTSHDAFALRSESDPDVDLARLQCVGAGDAACARRRAWSQAQAAGAAAAAGGTRCVAGAAGVRRGRSAAGSTEPVSGG